MTTKKVGRPRRQDQKHIEPNLYMVVDRITQEILASFNEDSSWIPLSEFGFEHLKDIKKSARFESLEKANEAIKKITAEMTAAGETEFNFEVVGIKAKTITIEKVEGVQTLIDRLGIA